MQITRHNLLQIVALVVITLQLYCAPKKDVKQVETARPEFTLSSPEYFTHGFPRIANVFQVCCSNEVIHKLFEDAYLWDLLVVDPAVHPRYLGHTEGVRKRNTNILLYAYYSAADVIPPRKDDLHRQLYESILLEWYMRDISGDPVPLFLLSNGQWTRMLNLTTPYQKFLPKFINDHSLRHAIFDGVYYDWVTGSISWLNRRRPRQSQNIDIDNDGAEDSDEKLNREWKKGLMAMLANSRKSFPSGTLIMGNAGWNNSLDFSSRLNGIMIEQFLEGSAVDKKRYGWSAIMKTYAHYAEHSKLPRASILMSNDDDFGNFKSMRFGLASTLLFDGFFCYTNRKNAYSQVWWYDEYAVDIRTGIATKNFKDKGYLGKPLSGSYEADDPSELLADWLNDTPLKVEDKVWRRDFENGIILINPGKKAKKIALNGIFRKIKGTINPAFNDGISISTLTLEKQDAIILLRSRP